MPTFGGDGVEFYQGVKFEDIGTWEEEYDKGSPTEILADASVVAEYEYNWAVISEYLPWVVG